MKVLYVSNPELFKDKYEPNLASGTYLWINKDKIMFNIEYHNILRDIDFEQLIEDMIIEVK